MVGLVTTILWVYLCGLVRGPVAISQKSRHNMEVDVVDLLSWRVVVLHQGGPIGARSPLDRSGYISNTAHDVPDDGIVEVVQRCDVQPSYNECVAAVPGWLPASGKDRYEVVAERQGCSNAFSCLTNHTFGHVAVSH